MRYTPNFDLPLVDGADYPDWLTTFNDAMTDADTAMATILQQAQDAKNGYTLAMTKAEQASTDATNALSQISGATQNATLALNKANLAAAKADAADAKADAADAKADAADAKADAADAKADAADAKAGMFYWYTDFNPTPIITVTNTVNNITLDYDQIVIFEVTGQNGYALLKKTGSSSNFLAIPKTIESSFITQIPLKAGNYTVTSSGCTCNIYEGIES